MNPKWYGNEFPADWAKHGKAAGPIRNAEMLTEFLPDYIVAFPGGKGTADMLRKAEKARVTNIEIVGINERSPIYDGVNITLRD